MDPSFLYNLLKELIKFKTVTSNQEEVKKALEFLEKEVFSQAKGVEVEWHEFNGVYNLVVKRGNPKVWLNTHIDVVPAPEELFIPKEDDKYIYGRGASDTKSQVAIYSLLFLEKELENKEFGLMIVGDEEVGGNNGSRQLAKIIKPEILFIGEPSFNKNLAVGHRGVLWVKLKKRFEGGHGSRPYNNAYERAMRFLREFFDKHGFRNIDGSLETYNIAFMNTTNQTFNKQPEDLEIGLDIRFLREPNLPLFFAELAKKVTIKARNEETRENLEGINFYDSPRAFFDEAMIEMYIKPLQPEIDDVILEMAKLVEQYYGFRPPISISLGGHDGRFFRESKVISWGVENMGSHTTQEKVDKEDLVKTYQVYKEILKKIT